MIAGELDRRGPAYETPLGDHRERAVLCQRCRRRETWTLRGICETCEPVEGDR